MILSDEIPRPIQLVLFQTWGMLDQEVLLLDTLAYQQCYFVISASLVHSISFTLIPLRALSDQWFRHLIITDTDKNLIQE